LFIGSAGKDIPKTVKGQTLGFDPYLYLTSISLRYSIHEEVKLNQKDSISIMKSEICSICGWWSQPNFAALAIVRDRAGIVSIDNTHAFWGNLVFTEDGKFDEGNSILCDKNGLANIHSSSIDIYEGIMKFSKVYLGRSDTIEYTARYDQKTDCWCGTFDGQRTGKGVTKFYIRELPEALLVDDLSHPEA